MTICRPIGCTVASGIVVVVGVCNRSQMRTSKFTCLIFGVSIGLDPGLKCTVGIFDRSKFKVTRDISPTISGWLLVAQAVFLLECRQTDRDATDHHTITFGNSFTLKIPEEPFLGTLERDAHILLMT